MIRPLEGKVAVVTGGSSGIGRASALALALAGAKVVVADVAVEAGEKTVHLIQQQGEEALFVPTDVTQAAEVRNLIRKAVDYYGSLDCLFNNAGIEGTRTSTAACTEEQWDRVININLKGVWLCMKYAIPYMREQGEGAIVNMSSVHGLSSGIQGYAPYVTSKHGVIGLTRAAAAEYARTGIRINAICPGYVRTPMIENNLGSQASQFESWLKAFVPAGRLGTQEEIAEAVVWLCSKAASFVVGHTLVVDGGFLAQ